MLYTPIKHMSKNIRVMFNMLLVHTITTQVNIIQIDFFFFHFFHHVRFTKLSADWLAQARKPI